MHVINKKSLFLGLGKSQEKNMPICWTLKCTSDHFKNSLRRQIRERTRAHVERSTSLSECHSVCLCALTNLYSLLFLRLDLTSPVYHHANRPASMSTCLSCFTQACLASHSTYALSWLCQRQVCL